MRIASGASGVLVGLYLADLANHGLHVNAALVGMPGAVSFGNELIASVPMGLASDAIAPRGLMTSGALLGALATQLFGMSSRPSIFFLSRTIEGLIRLMDSSRTIGEVVNVGNTEEITIEDLAHRVKERTCSSSPIVYIPYD